MIEIKAYISREKDGTYSIYVDDDAPINYGLIGEGATVEQAMDEWRRSYEEMKQSYEKDNMPFVEATFSFVYDIPSFITYFGNLFSLRGLSKITGVSAAQLSQYATGYRNPSQRTATKIQNGLRLFANELSHLELVKS